MYKNILASALVNLGDVVLTTSALALIKKNFPDARITLMIKPVVRDAIENNPVVDNVLVLDYRPKHNSFLMMFEIVRELRRRNFDLFISFDRKLRPAITAWLARIPTRIGPSKVFDDKPSCVTTLFTDVIAIDHDLDGGDVSDDRAEVFRARRSRTPRIRTHYGSEPRGSRHIVRAIAENSI